MYINIEHIEKTLYDKLSEIVDNVYVNKHPLSITERLKEFAMVRVARIIHNYGAYKQTTGYVDLYVRLRDSGVENSTEIHELTNKVMTLFPYSDDCFSIISPSLTFGDIEGEFTRIMIRLDLIIK